MTVHPLHSASAGPEQDWAGFLPLAARFITARAPPAPVPLVPEFALHLAPVLNPVWEGAAQFLNRPDIPPPFWSIAWPGGQALARHVLDHPGLARGKRVLDFASGSGLVALAAKKAGAARVVANDVDPLAIAAIGLNSALNALEVEVRHDNLVGKGMEEFDLILAGDFCYEWPMAGYAVEWLRLEAAAGREVIFADPGRPHAPAHGREELARFTVPTSTETEDAPQKSAGVFRLLAGEDL